MRAPWIAQPLPLEEAAADPAVGIACFLLVSVSIAWVVVTRRMMRRQRATTAQRWAGESPRRRLKDLWTYPP